MPGLERVIPRIVGEGEHLLVTGAETAASSSTALGQEAPLRRSRFSKVIGDRAEEVTLQHLRRKLDRAEARTLRWTAAEGRTPGWDIEYVDRAGNLVAVEVKGTQGPQFPSVELTSNEWRAAYERRGRYWLYLVADCTSTEPKIEPVLDPAGLADSGALVATPTRWRIEFG